MNSKRKGKDKERRRAMAQCVSVQQQMQRSCLRKGETETIKKGYGSPPLPSWKLYENPFYEGLAAAVVAAAEAAAAAAAMAVDDAEAEDEGGVLKETGGNARAPGTTDQRAQCASRASRPLFVPMSREHRLSCGSPHGQVPPKLSCGSPRSHLQARAPSSTSDSPASPPVKAQAAKLSTRSPQPHKSPQPTSSISPPLKAITLMRPRARGDAAWLSSVCKSASPSQCSALRIDAVEQVVVPSDDDHFAEPDLITSPRDYLRALNRSNISKVKPMESSTVILTLSEELKRALRRVHELERSQMSARREVDSLLKRFAEEKTMQKTREQERIQAAVVSLEEELEMERKARRRLEMENRKLSRNLTESSKAVVKVEKELDKERKARQLMEDVCDELAKEIGDDKAELEELKREHAKAREEMEEERRTLQMTEAWREERVQMKLLEAKVELEERCMALDKLKIELEMYPNSWQIQGADPSYKHQGEELREAAENLKAKASWSMLMLDDSVSYAPPSQDAPLSADDVSSLRLSRDNVRGRPEWAAHSNGRARDRAKWVLHSNEVARGESGRSGSDIDAGEESGGSLSDANDYPDMQDDAWRYPWPKSRKGMNGPLTASRLDLADGAFAGDGNGDEGNGCGTGSDHAGSQSGHSGQGHSGNLDDESKWNDNMEARQGVIALASTSDRESGRSSSCPVNRVMYWLRDGMEEERQAAVRLKQNHGAAEVSARVTHNDSAVYAAAIRGHMRLDHLQVEDDVEVSSFAGGSPAYYNHHRRSPDFMAHKRNWAIVPTYQSASQGRRDPMENSSAALQERKKLREWVKPLQGSTFQEKLLEDGGFTGPDAMSRQSRGQQLKR